MSDYTILVVEDNILSAELVKDLLEVSGYNVIVCHCANDAFNVLKKPPRPVLILTDIQMPGLDGLEMTKLIKSNDNLKDIPIVALTACAMKGDKERIMNGGCDGYLSKPINTHKFISQIESFLGGD